MIAEAQRRTAVAVERIELGERAVCQRHIAADEGRTVFQCVGELGVVSLDLAVYRLQTVALAVVDGGIGKCQLRPFRRRRIAENTVVGRMDVRMCEAVVVTVLMEADAAPLTAHTVVRQIGKQLVQAVATECHGFVGRPFAVQCTVHIDCSFVGEIDRHACRNGQCSPCLHFQCVLEDNGSGTGQRGVRRDFPSLYEFCIPAVDPEIYFLLYTVLECECNVVCQQLRRGSVVSGRCHLYEDTDAVFVAHLQSVGLITVGSRQLYAVHVHPEACLVALFQPDAVQAQSVSRPVVYPEGLCRCGDVRESGVKPQCIGLE